ncbi:MAG: ABC transporter permease [Anaerolineae bacterium]
MTLLAVLLKDIKLLLRDRGELISLFLMPLAFIIPVGLAMGPGDGYGISRSNTREYLPVVLYDEGPVAQRLASALGESLDVRTSVAPDLYEQLGLAECHADSPACMERAAAELVRRDACSAALIVPAGMSAAVEAGRHVTLTLLYNATASAEDRQLVQAVVEGTTTYLSIAARLEQSQGELAAIAGIAPTSSADGDAAEGDTRKSAVHLETVYPTSAASVVTPDTYQQTVPGYTVMFVFFIVSYLSDSIRAEKHEGTFRRMSSMPVGRSVMLGGKLLAAMTVGVIQVALLFCVGAVLFGLDLGKDPLALVLLTVALAAAATAIGTAASVTRLGNSLVPPLVIGALLGGCMFPLSLMPSFLRTVSYFVPHRWALAGFQDLLVRNGGLMEVLPEIGALLAFAAAFFALAVRRLDVQE